jgi:hypothetical protein
MTLTLSASDLYKSHHVSRTQQDYAASSSELASKISSTTPLEGKPATEYITWVRSKLIEEQKLCQAIWSGSSTSDQESSQSAVVDHVRGIWEEVWKDVKTEIEKECIERYLVEHVQRGEFLPHPS